MQVRDCSKAQGHYHIYIFYEIRKKYYRNWSQCPRNPYLWGMLMMFVENTSVIGPNTPGIHIFLWDGEESWAIFPFFWEISMNLIQIDTKRSKRVNFWNSWKGREKPVKTPWKGREKPVKTRVFQSAENHDFSSMFYPSQIWNLHNCLYLYGFFHGLFAEFPPYSLTVTMFVNIA